MAGQRVTGTGAEFALGPVRVVSPVPGTDGVEILDDATIVIRDGLITAVHGPGCPDPGPRRIELPRRCVTPALIDCHTHAVFAGWRFDEREMRLGGATYADIMAAGGGIVNTVRATRAADEDELTERTAGFLRTMRRRGIATVEIKSGYGLDLDTELKCLRAAVSAGRRAGIRVVATYMGAHAVPVEFHGRADDYIDDVCHRILPAVAASGLAQFCDVFCERGAFSVQQSRRVLETARDLGLKLKVHADELAASGGTMLAAELNAVSAEHLLHASEEAMAGLAHSGTVAVLLPGTSFHLGERYGHAQRLSELGVRIAVATDFNPGSSPILDLRFVMYLACARLGMTPGQALSAVTLGAAAALGLDGETGAIRPGYRADLAVWATDDYRSLVSVIGDDPLELLYIDGQLMPDDGGG